MSTCFCIAADGKGKFFTWLVLGILGINIFLYLKSSDLLISSAISYGNTYFSDLNYHWLTETGGKYSPKCYTVQMELLMIVPEIRKLSFNGNHGYCILRCVWLKSVLSAMTISTLWLQHFIAGPRVGGALHEAAVPLWLRRGASAGRALQVAPRKAGKLG